MYHCFHHNKNSSDFPKKGARSHIRNYMWFERWRRVNFLALIFVQRGSCLNLRLTLSDLKPISSQQWFVQFQIFRGPSTTDWVRRWVKSVKPFRRYGMGTWKDISSWKIAVLWLYLVKEWNLSLEFQNKSGRLNNTSNFAHYVNSPPSSEWKSAVMLGKRDFFQSFLQ